jgi:hypothetical protein
LDSLYIKAQVGEYWRYTRQHPLLALEANVHGEVSDMISVSPHGHIYETEVKISLSDLRHDNVKRKHYYWRNPEKDYRAQRLASFKEKTKQAQLAFECFKELNNSIKAERNIWDEEPVINYFYFAVPYNIANKAIEIVEQMFPYAGVVGVRGIPQTGPIPELVVSFRKPKLLASSTIGFKQCYYLSRHQSGTIVRLAKELCLTKEQAKGHTNG